MILAMALWRNVETNVAARRAAEAEAREARLASEANGRQIAELERLLTEQMRRVAQLVAAMEDAGVPIPPPEPAPSESPDEPSRPGRPRRTASPRPSDRPSSSRSHRPTPSPSETALPSPPCVLPPPYPCLV